MTNDRKINLYTITFCLLIAYGILLGVASFVEKYNGTSTAGQFYYHPAVGVIWILLIIIWLALTIRKRLSIIRHLGYTLLHSAFIFIIAGALISHFSGTEGILHIRKGEQSNIIYTDEHVAHVLPFHVKLTDFQVTRYPGSDSPQSYKSSLIIHGRDIHKHMDVSMNNVISVQNYRIFQTAYDEDESGTILTVSHDPVGMTTTYIGYALLLIGILLLPLQKKSRIRILFNKLKLLSIFLMIPCADLMAQPDWSEIHIQNPNGRIEPIDTYCRTLARKIHHDEEVCETDAISFIFGLISKPEYWNAQPIIYQPNKDIQNRFGAQGKHLKFNDLFDTYGNYLLKEDIEAIYSTPSSQLDKEQKDLLKLDERINIVLTLEQGKMLPMFPLPDDDRQRWFSPGDDLYEFKNTDSLFVSHIIPWYISEPQQEIVDMIAVYQQKKSNCPLPSPLQIKMEHLYNLIRPFHISAMGYLSFGILLLIMTLLQTICRASRVLKSMSRIITGLTILFFAIHTAGLIARWYIGGQAPWSNAYESMIFAGWCIFGGCLLFIRRSMITLPLCAFFSGIILLVASMNWMDPVITPLVPVLQSYWLMIHVAVIMCGYGFLAIGFLLGTMGLILMTIPNKTPSIKARIEEMAIINEISLLIGLMLMTAGTFLGAIWANEAWGRYWGWDPKETWALITILVYTVITHARLIPKLNNSFALNSLSTFGFSSVLMTYFGVNYYLSGMHSYGSGNAPSGFYIFFIIYLAISILCLVAYIRNKREAKTCK